MGIGNNDLKYSSYVKRRPSEFGLSGYLIYTGISVLMLLFILYVYQGIQLIGNIVRFQVTMNPFLLIWETLTETPFTFVIFLIVSFLVGYAVFYYFAGKRKIMIERTPGGELIQLDPYEIHGSNRMMDHSELGDYFELRPESNPGKGTIYGVTRDTGELLSLGWDGTKCGEHRLPNMNLLMVGPSGSRKTSGVLLPNLYNLITAGYLIAATDPKGENYLETIAYARSQGYKVWCLNTLKDQLRNSDGVDILRLIKESETPIAEVQTMTDTIIANTSGVSKDFWNLSNTNCLRLAILYVTLARSFIPRDMLISAEEAKKCIPEPGDDPWRKYRVFREVYALITNKGGKSMEDTIAEAMMDPYDRELLESSFNAWTSHKEKDGMRTSLAIQLGIFQIPEIVDILSRDEISIEDMLHEKTIIYLVCSDQDDTFKVVNTLFLSTLFDRMTRYADRSPGKRLPIPLFMLFEEAKNIGRIPGMARKISTLRSRNIVCWFTFQTIGQMIDLYNSMGDDGGKALHEYEAIFAGCSMKLCLGAAKDDETTKKTFSEACGKMSALVPQVGETHAKFGIKLALEETVRKSPTEIDVITPDAIASMAIDDILIIPPNVNRACFAKKWYYKKHPAHKVKMRRKDTKEPVFVNTFDHIPASKRKEGEFELIDICEPYTDYSIGQKPVFKREERSGKSFDYYLNNRNDV